MRVSWKEIKRVLQITKKPSLDESKKIIKATVLGIALIGLLGFAISILAKLLII